LAESSPIILIGAARSGTKFLRDILASGSGTAAVPYDVNYVWRYGAEKAPNDVLDPAGITNSRIHFIRKSLHSLAKANSDDILIEKTVANTLRVPFVDAVFPSARYVHLIRDGREVTESSMRQWQAPPNWSALLHKVREIPVENLGYVAWFGWNFAKGLLSGRKGGKVWGPRFPQIDFIAEKGPLSRVCAQQWLESYTRASVNLQEIPNASARVFTIRYEDLVQDEMALSKLLEQLEMPDKEKILATYRKKLRPSEPKIWRKLSLNDIEVINSTLSKTLCELGYTK
tara:strand:- start:5080 stop:5937 length:858 start_codon:yes stop_codon:yes gene_type:complete